MKNETLELLLLDRALGQLAPETAELVEEYLAQNPAAAVHATALSDTVGLARTTVRRDDAGPGRPEADGWARVSRAERWRTVAAQGWKLAACVAVGIAVGWAAHRPVPETGPVVAWVQPPVHARKTAEENPAAAFWIAERRAAAANDRAAQPRTAMRETPGVVSPKGGAR
jgi:hypothetical protein